MPRDTRTYYYPEFGSHVNTYWTYAFLVSHRFRYRSFVLSVSHHRRQALHTVPFDRRRLTGHWNDAFA